MLDLEQSYTGAIQELYMTRDQELSVIHARHTNEMESSPVNMTSIFTRHVEEMELFQATWQSDLLQTQQTQRQEYREFVIELYREYQTKIASLSDEKRDLLIAEKKLDGKEIVEAAASRVKCWEPLETGDKSSLSSTSSRRRSSVLSQNTEYNESVKSIQEMGFAKEQAEAALLLSNQSLETAICLLLENPAKVDSHIQQQTVTPFRRSITQTPRSRSNSTLTENKRHSLQRYSTTPALLNNTKVTSSTSKSWNPISFLQQQKSAMENTNLSSVRKLGGWLSKAMENFGIDEDKQRATKNLNAPPLVESFTISMGTAQVKSTHNLRLLVTDQVVPFDPLREMAYRAETSTKLYTSNLSASIVLVELSELNREQSLEYGWRNYKAGKGSNQSLFERCQQSTEFHFPDIETQLSLIQQDFEKNTQGLEEGSFFITKHSNLPNIQVVFHLIMDSSTITTTDISNRHALVLGLRNILKLTSQYDISSLSIPLLLLPDKYLSRPEYTQNYQQWLQKRGEVIMKCIKGYLIENSQSGKRVLQNEESNLGMRTIEFLLPNQPHVYSHLTPSLTNPTGVDDHTPQEIELAFQQFRSSLASLFRTS